MSSTSMQALLFSISSLQETSNYSDLTIFCGDDIHRVHKAIVCPRSEFFTAACKHCQEALKNEVTLPDDDPRLVKLMIDYFYQLDYDDRPQSPVAVENGIDEEGPQEVPPESVPEPSSPVAGAIGFYEELLTPQAAPAEEASNDLAVRKNRVRGKKKKRHAAVLSKFIAYDEELATNGTVALSLFEETKLSMNARMYALADKYGIEDLKELAREKFARVATQDWNKGGFAQAVQIVYDSTPKSDSGLRDVVVNTINQHRDLMKDSEIENMLEELNGLAVSLLKVVCSSNPLADSWGHWC